MPAMNTPPEQHPPRNGRTALVLLSVAVVFFIGVIVKRALLG